MSEAKNGDGLSLASTVTLRNGLKMPIFGLGTWLSKDGGECEQSVTAALEAGYPLIDTARMYENETDVSRALKSWKGQPPFIVTKLRGADHNTEADNGRVEAALRSSLADLGLSCVDLFLVHNPSGKQCISTWRSMLSCRDKGLCRAVGGSNFGAAQLQGLKDAGLELPEVNQIEYHMWLPQKETAAYCRDNDIRLQGYCPLARCKRFGKTAATALAENLGVSEAALAIRWSLEKGVITIPKSSNPGRIAANANVFNMDPLTEEAHKILDLLGEENFKASNSVNSMDTPWDEVK